MKEQLIVDEHPGSEIDAQKKKLSYKNKDAFQNQSFISSILYTWAYNIIKLANVTQIKNDDLGFICKIKSCSTYIQHIYNTYFTKQFKNKTYSILKTLCRTHITSILYIIFLNLIYTFLKVYSILLFRTYIQSFHSSMPSQNLIHSGILIIFFDLIEILLSKHLTHTQTVLAYKSSIEINCLIFNKILKTVPSSSQTESNSISNAELVNYTQIDSQNIVHVIRLFPIIINIPIMVIVYSIMLFKYMGVAFVYGVISLVIFILCNLCLQKKMKRNMGLKQKALDARMKTTSNVLYNLKLLKLYGWDNLFLKNIQNARDEEITKLTNVFNVANIIRTLLWFSPVGTIIISIGAYSYYGKSFSAENVFTCLSIFTLIQDPLREFGNVVNSIMEMLVSLERIERYLNGNDIKMNHIHYYKRESIEKGIALEIRNGNFKWNKNAFGLNELNVVVNKGKLVFVIGEIGSGKSSLLHAVMGNMETLSNESEVIVNGSVAYVSQVPWIQNDSVRNNILFYKSMYEDKYKEVLSLTEMNDDINMLVNGDMTQIGEKGVTLSGGQKMRIALARGLYADSDIYLLDDPLAALDANIGKSIMTKCIKGYLKEKTRILITHSLQYLGYADQVLFIKNGKIVFDGTYKELKQSVYYEELVKSKLNEDKGGNVNEEKGVRRKEGGIEKKKEQNGKSGIGNAPQQQGGLNKGKQLSIYSKYILKNGGYKMGIIVCIFVFIWQISRGISDICLVHWTKSKHSNEPNISNTKHNNTYYYLLYAGFALFGSLFIYIRLIYISKHTLKGSNNLHKEIIHSILHAPINLYHDIVPRGQIMNQLSKDLSVVDFLGSVMFGNILSFGSSFIFSLIICSIYQMYCLLFLPILLFGGIYLMRFYLKGCRQVTRLESESRTPLINLINEVSSGSDIIRAFNTQKSFINNYYLNQDSFFKTNLFLNGINLWFALMVDLLIFSFKLSLIIITLSLRNYLSNEVIGLLLSYSIQIQNSLGSFLQCFSTFENAMLAFQRCVSYTSIISERPYKMERDVSLTQWPSHGKIEFTSLCVKYRPNLDNVLHDINITINPCEKIGICGRTGSGKSTLALSLFRLIEANEGSIFIDDVNISEVGLMKLRNAITIIPQDVCLFEGTLRYNIDPVGIYKDDQILEVMKRVNACESKETLGMDLDMKVMENGNNLSGGQKQVICIVRAVLRKSKVMVIDEGTASIDYKNEEIILKELVDIMKDSTVIVIAHRIKTIVNMDRIIVVDNGKVVEFDTPKKLLNDRNSKFYELYNSFNI